MPGINFEEASWTASLSGNLNGVSINYVNVKLQMPGGEEVIVTHEGGDLQEGLIKAFLRGIEKIREDKFGIAIKRCAVIPVNEETNKEKGAGPDFMAQIDFSKNGRIAKRAVGLSTCPHGALFEALIRGFQGAS